MICAKARLPSEKVLLDAENHINKMRKSYEKLLHFSEDNTAYTSQAAYRNLEDSYIAFQRASLVTQSPSPSASRRSYTMFAMRVRVACYGCGPLRIEKTPKNGKSIPLSILPSLGPSHPIGFGDSKLRQDTTRVLAHFSQSRLLLLEYS